MSEEYGFRNRYERKEPTPQRGLPTTELREGGALRMLEHDTYKKQISALQAELAECKRDAERYRYAQKHLVIGVVDENNDLIEMDNAAIDAAMKEEK